MTSPPFDLLTTLLVETPDSTLDLIRWNLSDQVETKVSCVLGNKISPVNYAKLMARSKWNKEFAKLHSCPSFFKLPLVFQQTWFFDHILISSLIVRNSAVRTQDLDAMIELTSVTRPFFLQLNKPSIAQTRYSGLHDYQSIADNFIGYHCKAFTSSRKSLLWDLSSHVGNSHDEKWLFYHSHWNQILLSTTKRTKAFRSFLHACLVSYLVPEDHVEDVFDITRSDLLLLMEEFLYLGYHASLDDITQYVDDLVRIFNYPKPNLFFDVILNAPFDVFAQIHEQNYGHEFGKQIMPQI